MESLFPLTINLFSWELPHCALAGCSVFNNTVIQMEVTHDGGNDCGCHHRTECGHGRDCGPCGEINNAERRESCNYFSQEILGALSHRPPVYVSQLESFDPLSGTLECWDRAYVGTGPLGPITEPLQRESLGLFYAVMRDMAHARHGLRLLAMASWVRPLRSTRAFRVLVSEKTGRRRMANVLEVAEWTQGHRMPDPAAQAVQVGFEVSLVRWEDREGGFRRQLESLSLVDIYISSGGGGSLNAFFLSDGSALIASTLCNFRPVPEECIFFESQWVYEHLTHVGCFVYSVDDPTELCPSAGSDSHTYFDVILRRDKFHLLLESAAHFVRAKLGPGRHSPGYPIAADGEQPSLPAALPEQPDSVQAQNGLSQAAVGRANHPSASPASEKTADGRNAATAGPQAERGPAFSYHHCTSHGVDEGLRRCQLFNVCAHAGQIVYFLGADPAARAPLFFDPAGRQRGFANQSRQVLVSAGGGARSLWVTVVSDPTMVWITERRIRTVVWHAAPALFLSEHGRGDFDGRVMEDLLPLAVNLVTWEGQRCEPPGCDIFDNTVILTGDAQDAATGAGGCTGADCGLLEEQVQGQPGGPLVDHALQSIFWRSVLGVAVIYCWGW
jgi:hypothetical protein